MSAQPLHFRTASAADSVSLLSLMEEFYHEEHLPFNREMAGSAVGELLSNRTLGEILLMEWEGGLIGYLVGIHSFILEFGGRQTFLDELYIRERWRGRGFAREALRAAEELARRNGARVLRLEVARENSRALRLYERVGFECHDRFTMTKRLE